MWEEETLITSQNNENKNLKFNKLTKFRLKIRPVLNCNLIGLVFLLEVARLLLASLTALTSIFQCHISSALVFSIHKCLILRSLDAYALIHSILMKIDSTMNHLNTWHLHGVNIVSAYVAKPHDSNLPKQKFYSPANMLTNTSLFSTVF